MEIVSCKICKNSAIYSKLRLIIFTLFILVVCGCSNQKIKSITAKDVTIDDCCPVVDTLVSVIDSEEYTIYYPHYREIDLACDSMPNPVDNKCAIFVCEAVFTGELLSEFKHSNIAGHHVSRGVKYRGYPCKHNTGLFSYYKGRWNFSIGAYAEELDRAAENKGMAFEQNMIIYENEILQIAFKGANVYRTLCELNGNLCIIESKKVEPYRDFVQNLHNLEVKYAMYLDMGGGWNYAWFRQTENEIVELHKKTHSYTTNWLVFYK